jgi:hypothetical protein
MQPQIIEYNLKDRGRQYRGKERNFNIKAICDAVNGPACQERVKTRAMLGYFGHKMRLLAGMEPVESVVIAGKYNEVEPAVVTTYLEAFPDGTIKHKTEFLDTDAGRRAARMASSRVGGFSSAIDENRPEFFGFDYVLDPNFHHNRPFALDSAGLTLDAVIGEAKNEEEAMLDALLNAKDKQIANLAAALDSVTVENEELLSMLAKQGGEIVRPMTVSLDSANRLLRDAAFFKRAALPGYVQPQTDNGKQSEENYRRVSSMILRGR